MEKDTEIEQKQPKQGEEQKKAKFTALVFFKKEFATNPGTPQSSEHGRKFHSLRQEKRNVQGNIIIDHRFALKCLRNMIVNDFQGKYKTAVIYFNDTNEAIEKYSYDQLRMAKEPIWQPLGEFGIQIVKFK